MSTGSLDKLKKSKEKLEEAKNTLGIDEIQELTKKNLETLNDLSEKVSKNITDIEKHHPESPKKDNQTKTNPKSVYFALGAIGSIMTGTVLSNDPIALLENLRFQGIIGALLVYVGARQAIKNVTESKK